MKFEQKRMTIKGYEKLEKEEFRRNEGRGRRKFQKVVEIQLQDKGDAK